MLSAGPVRKHPWQLSTSGPSIHLIWTELRYVGPSSPEEPWSWLNAVPTVNGIRASMRCGEAAWEGLNPGKDQAPTIFTWPDCHIRCLRARVARQTG